MFVYIRWEIVCPQHKTMQRINFKPLCFRQDIPLKLGVHCCCTLGLASLSRRRLPGRDEMSITISGGRIKTSPSYTFFYMILLSFLLSHLWLSLFAQNIKHTSLTSGYYTARHSPAPHATATAPHSPHLLRQGWLPLRLGRSKVYTLSTSQDCHTSSR